MGKDGEEEVKEEIPKEPETGYLNLKLRLVHPPEPNGKDYCHFSVYMLSSARIMMVKDDITPDSPKTKKLPKKKLNSKAGADEEKQEETVEEAEKVVPLGYKCYTDDA